MSDWKDTEIGIIPSDWEILPLTKLIEFTVDNRGKTVPIVEEKTSYPLIATNCIKESALFPVKENLRFLTEETYKTWFRAHPKYGDIIIVNKGTPGLVCFVPHPVDFCIAQDMVAIRVNEKVYNKYLFAYMRSHFFKYQVSGLNVGTTIPHLKKTNFKDLNIPIPPKNYQKTSGDLYYILSLKIENLRRQNETLEQIAQTLFKHWFIDFKFPNADSKPYKSSGGAMFASELEDIPEGWRVGKLGDVVSINSKSIDKNYPHKIIEYVDISSVGTGILENTTQYKLSEAPSRARRLVQHGDVIWSGVRPNRKSYLFICKPIDNLVVSTGFIVLSPTKIPSSYLYAWVTTSMFVDYLTLNASGSAYPAVKAEHFEISKILLPSESVLAKFQALVDPMRTKNHENSLQIEILTKTRDSLLPKLMSGQLLIEV